MKELGKKLQESLTKDSLARISQMFEEIEEIEDKEPSARIIKKLEKIAKDKLNVKTLETRNSDGLDFYDCSIWGIKDALIAAYKLGKAEK